MWKKNKKQELFCNSCGYYNGDSTAVSWDNEADLLAEENKEEICSDTLAVAITAALSDEAKEWDINGEKVTLSVKVVE